MGQDPVVPGTTTTATAANQSSTNTSVTAANNDTNNTKKSSPVPQARNSPVKDIQNNSSNKDVKVNGVSPAPGQKPTLDDAGNSDDGNTSGGNGNKENKKVQKGGKNWVPLPIDLPKPDRRRDRRSPPRRSSRRYEDYDDDYYDSRPPRNPRYRPPPRRSDTNNGGSWRSDPADRRDRDTRERNSNSTRPAPRSGNNSERRPVRHGPRSHLSSRNDRNTRSNNHYEERGERGHHSEYSHTRSAGAKTPNSSSGDQTPYMMPYMGTYYYNGAPLFNMVSTSIKDCIQKQM